MNSFFLKLASVYGFMAVAMGAFAAHGLKERLPSQSLGWIQTASHYQLIHAVLIGMLSLVSLQKAEWPSLTWGMGFFSGGIFFFSGSLYAMALSDFRPLGAITPIGGVLLLTGWAWLLWWAFSIVSMKQG